jgi:hypothetical protein
MPLAPTAAGRAGITSISLAARKTSVRRAGESQPSWRGRRTAETLDPQTQRMPGRSCPSPRAPGKSPATDGGPRLGLMASFDEMLPNVGVANFRGCCGTFKTSACRASSRFRRASPHATAVPRIRNNANGRLSFGTPRPFGTASHPGESLLSKRSMRRSSTVVSFVKLRIA